MGGKRSWRRKYVYFCLAGLISFSGCAALIDFRERHQAVAHLREAQGLLARGDYEGSLKENQKALSLAAMNEPGDEALFNIGMIYVHPENPDRDDRKALMTFRQITKEHPGSPWAERARILSDILDGAEPGATGYGQEGKEIRGLLRGAEALLVKGDYEGSLRENQKALSLAGNRPPADEGLFNLGMIYAHPANPKRDNGKAIALLKQVVKDYPKSFWAERAKVWAGVLENFERSKKVDIEIEEKKRDKGR